MLYRVVVVLLFVGYWGRIEGIRDIFEGMWNCVESCVMYFIVGAVG